LPAVAPIQFRALPEFLLDDPADFVTFLAKYAPDELAKLDLHSIVTMCFTFLAEKQYVKNPYLKAKFVEVLFFFTFDFGIVYENGKNTRILPEL
jgi:ubiquitin conjugation factor E4 B